MDSTIWYLENHDITGIIQSIELDAIFGQEPTKSIAKTKDVFETSHQDVFFYILKGKIIVGDYNEQGNAIPIIILKPGDILRLEPNKSTTKIGYAKATMESVGKFIHTDMLKQKIGSSSFMALHMKMLGVKAKDIESRLESLLFKDSKSRIIEFILYNLEKRGERVGYEYVIRNFSTHQEVADMTATSRQTVTMVLNELRANKILSFDRKRMLIRDLDQLKSFIP
jgi:hypothetical protein